MKPIRALLLATLAVGLSACTSTAATPGGPEAPKPVAVVASTDVYGDIVKVIGGDAVSVTSIIDDPDKDPHEYEANAQTQLAVSKARLVVENGGGYDDFVDTMLSSAATKPTVVNVADLSGYDQEPASGEFNEHLWYDFPTMTKLAGRLSADLAAAAPEQAATFTANAKTFTDQLQRMEQSEAAIKKDHAGEGVAITEPVPLYLLAAAGLDNLTPEAFSEAVEEGTDVAPAVLKQTTDLFDTQRVKLLAYNSQTSGPQTETVLAAARKNSVAVIPVTETLPTGQTYLTWMQGYLDAVSAALAD
ncbi:metal ABC transporter solute-binding protein, Zn/Mn family [uncultured Friedmanniella sp.]|uniref:metal ABC transporter solute-binding protein, Zn/Mn family n=1 Tax=uncultured Friedmanniella sp. TaxID=335381 RepID=UPI0035CC4CE8